MTTIENIRKIIAAALLVTLMIPAIQHCAALPEETEIPEAEQQILDEQLFDVIKCGGNLNDIRTALENGADPDAKLSQYCETPLMELVMRKGDIAIIQDLITAGADLNKRNYGDGKTALIYAMPKRDSRPNNTVSFTSQLETIKTLIDANADLNIQNNYGETALFYAVEYSDSRVLQCVIELLIKAGADETIQDNKGKTALQRVFRFRSHTTYESFEQALTARNNATYSRTHKLPEKKLQQAHAYLLEGPLAISPLSQIFLQYATEYIPVVVARQRAIDATELQKQRAADTRRNALIWRAQQRKAATATK